MLVFKFGILLLILTLFTLSDSTPRKKRYKIRGNFRRRSNKDVPCVKEDVPSPCDVQCNPKHIYAANDSSGVNSSTTESTVALGSESETVTKSVGVDSLPSSTVADNASSSVPAASTVAGTASSNDTASSTVADNASSSVPAASTVAGTTSSNDTASSTVADTASSNSPESSTVDITVLPNDASTSTGDPANIDVFKKRLLSKKWNENLAAGVEGVIESSVPSDFDNAV